LTPRQDRIGAVLDFKRSLFEDCVDFTLEQEAQERADNSGAGCAGPIPILDGVVL
jgi:hypothetical protein